MRIAAILALGVAGAALAPATYAQDGAATKGSYELVWADEFDTEGPPDPAKWVWDTHANKIGWYNKELQYYAADRPENARVEGGRLIITARKEVLSDRADAINRVGSFVGLHVSSGWGLWQSSIGSAGAVAAVVVVVRVQGGPRPRSRK